MKNFILIIAISFLLPLSIFAQVTVTGHVSAEVIESVSAHNYMNTLLKVQPDYNGNIDLGTIHISDASQSMVDVNIADFNVTNNTGHQAFSKVNSNLLMADNSGSKDISLSSLIEGKQLSGDYNGKLTVVVSYN